MQRPELLLVDDDVALLMAIAENLEEAGFHVARAASAEISLLLIKEGVPFEIMVTDVVLPGALDGFALAHLARVFLPRLAIIYTTGFVEVARLRSPGAVYGDVLAKPYRIDALIMAVRATCAAPRKVLRGSAEPLRSVLGALPRPGDADVTGHR